MDILSFFGTTPEQTIETPTAPTISPEIRIKTFKNQLLSLTGRRSLWEVWRDWIEIAALTLSQAVDRRKSVWEPREQEYLRIVKRYNKKELQVMAEMLAALTLIFEDGGPRDVLGELFQELELSSKWAGQFFTPLSVATLTAKMVLADAAAKIEEQGWITISDPAVGAGAMPLGALLALQEMGYGAQHAVFFGQDIDPKAVYMTYIQMSLMGMAGVVFCADTLRRPMLDSDWMTDGDMLQAVWFTPAFVFGGWRARLRSSRT